MRVSGGSFCVAAHATAEVPDIRRVKERTEDKMEEWGDIKLHQIVKLENYINSMSINKNINADRCLNAVSVKN